MPTGDQRGLGGDVGALKPPRIEDQAPANVLVGTGAPSNALGQVGALYIRLDASANARLYQKTGASTWQALTTG